jgi:Probable Zinc-ribbon domain/PilZ domain
MPTVSESYNLYVLRPDLAKEWHPTRNGSLGPKDVTPGSRKKVWWLCDKGHWWLASVRCRTRGMRCTFCLSLKKHGDQRMIDVKPELLKEWHPSRNMELKAGEVSFNHREKVWWICAQGHEWQATIRARLRGKACPICNIMVAQVTYSGRQRMNVISRTAGDFRLVSDTTHLSAFHDGLTNPHTGMDLRKSRRYERAETVMVEKLRTEIIGYAQLKNFSADGMMLLSDFAVSPGEFIKIRFDKPLHSSIPKTVASRVVWCRDLENKDEAVSRFGIGLSLT